MKYYLTVKKSIGKSYIDSLYPIGDVCVAQPLHNNPNWMTFGLIEDKKMATITGLKNFNHIHQECLGFLLVLSIPNDLDSIESVTVRTTEGWYEHKKTKDWFLNVIQHIPTELLEYSDDADTPLIKYVTIKYN